jgi:hypothetical protein
MKLNRENHAHHNNIYQFQITIMRITELEVGLNKEDNRKRG